MTYEEQLQTPEWEAKRQEVIDYFWGYCTKCGTSKNLQVHHKYYESGRMAWEYPINVCLITLCKDCHTLEHNLVPERRQTRTIGQVMVEWLEDLLKHSTNAKKIH